MTKLSRCCVECGQPYEPGQAWAEFCGSPCRKRFHNRRMLRGAELYDMFMALRYQRAVGKALGLWQIMCRMGQSWRAADQADRAGRRSWSNPETAVTRHVRHRATINRG